MNNEAAQRDRAAAARRRPAGVLVFDAACGVTDLDQVWTDATGLDRAQTIGEGWLDALAPASRAEALSQLERAARGSASSRGWEVVREGSVRLIDVVAQPVPSTTQASERCIVAIVD